MSGAWTPGPWAFHKRGQRVYGGKTGGMDVAQVRINPDFEANGHLIAAAPDLYAALDDLLASYAEPDQQICCGGHDCGCRGASVRDLAEHHARAAIAKARGAA